MSHSHSESKCSTSRRVALTLAIGFFGLLDCLTSASAAARISEQGNHKAGDATVVNVDREGSISFARNPCDHYVLASTTSETIVAAKCETPPPRRRPCYL